MSVQLPATQRSVVVMSGGQDSTTCLAVALKAGEVALAVSYFYGQKHEAELIAAADICHSVGVEHTVVDLRPILQNMQSSALVNHGDTSQPHSILEGLPASFVPARNALFLTAAYGLAIELKADTVYTGVCETDYSGYPDCRDEFIRALNNALNTGYQSTIKIETPLMWLDKADTFKLAEDLGWIATIVEKTLTCYNGIATRNPWGRGCGECGACDLRAKGFAEYKRRYHSEQVF